MLEQIPLGVYWGLASVAGGAVYGMALNVGWSPYYQNKEKTIEVSAFPHSIPRPAAT